MLFSPLTHRIAIMILGRKALKTKGKGQQLA